MSLRQSCSPQPLPCLNSDVISDVTSPCVNPDASRHPHTSHMRCRDWNNNGSVHAKSPYTRELLSQVRCSHTDMPGEGLRERTTLEKLELRLDRYISSVSANEVTASCEKLVSSPVIKGAGTSRRIAVMTCGQDVQGMNAALRAVVRTGLYVGCEVYYIKEGFNGMMKGGDNIVEATWTSTLDITRKGGSVLGSGHCSEVKTHSGKLTAAKNLSTHGITDLVCIGDPASLCDVYQLREDWPTLMRELSDNGSQLSDKCAGLDQLNVCAVVSSPYNDFRDTDRTLSFSSTLQRVMAVVDDVTTPSRNQTHVFVLELEGSSYGFLTLEAGIACEASAIFIPEDPPLPDWRDKLCDYIKWTMTKGLVCHPHIVMVSEAARDSEGEPITSEEICQVLNSRLQVEVVPIRLDKTLQRAGKITAQDRLEASRLGCEAVLTLLQSTCNSPLYVIGLSDVYLVKVPLATALYETRRMRTEIRTGTLDDVIKYSGRRFLANIFLHHICNHPAPSIIRIRPPRLGLVVVGQPAGGINAVARAFVLTCLYECYTPIILQDGWSGFVHDKVKEASWESVQRWSKDNGANFGCGLQTAGQVGLYRLARNIAKYRLCGVIIVGGFQAFQSACQMEEQRHSYPHLDIPITVVPACVNNTVPGCHLSLGTDTALNQVCQICDALRHSAHSTRKVVNLVELGGGTNGYLPAMAAIVVGADQVFLPELPFSVEDIKKTCDEIRVRFQTTNTNCSLIICHKNSNPNLTTDVIHNIINDESCGLYNYRKVVIDVGQIGRVCSYTDRYMGTSAGVRATRWMMARCREKAAQTGKYLAPVTVTSTQPDSFDAPVDITTLKSEADFELKRPTDQWWLQLCGLPRVFSTTRWGSLHGDPGSQSEGSQMISRVPSDSLNY